LSQLNEGFYLLTGLIDKNRAELILTAGGNIKNIVFIEELIAQAPMLKRWKFTAFKSSTDIKHISIVIGGYQFNSGNMFFYSNDHPNYPDEIDISVTHNELTNENKDNIINGIFIFLDNYLGELNFMNNIDNLRIVTSQEVEKELIPIGKLSDFLHWRKQEFIEKYDSVRHNTEEDSYAHLEAELQNGKPISAVYNATLLNWDNKASHPWFISILVIYKSSLKNGMPDSTTYELLNLFEDEIMLELKDFDGYLNIARQTADNVREIFFACKEYRKPAKVLYELTCKYECIFIIEYEIYKDKYWQTLNQFITN